MKSHHMSSQKKEIGFFTDCLFKPRFQSHLHRSTRQCWGDDGHKSAGVVQYLSWWLDSCPVCIPSEVKDNPECGDFPSLFGGEFTISRAYGNGGTRGGDIDVGW
jgi:hypothetical protein